MNAWKFLARGGIGRFSEFEWPQPAAGRPGAWVAAEQPLDPCRVGIHACSLEQLPAWIDDELWEIELGGAVVEHESVLLAQRGRLVRRVDAWDAQAAQEFADECARRAGEEAGEAPGLAAAFAADAAALAEGRRPESSELASALERAATVQTPGATAANLGFVVAHATGRQADDYDEAFAAERRRQVAWLARRLGLRV